MSYVVVVLNIPNDSVVQANQDVNFGAGADRELNLLENYIMAIAAGAKPASGYVVTRATDPVVTTDADPNSTLNTFNHL